MLLWLWYHNLLIPFLRKLTATMPPQTKFFLPRRMLIGLLLLCIPVATLLSFGFLLKRELLPLFSYTLQNAERVTLNRAVLKRSLANAEVWLWNDFNTRGYFGYEYNPRLGTYTQETRIVHQLLAARFLAQYSLKNSLLASFHKKNLEYIFLRSYNEEGGRGYIVFGGKPSLGANGIALSTLARSPLLPEYRDKGMLLAAALLAQQDEHGAFEVTLDPTAITPDNEQVTKTIKLPDGTSTTVLIKKPVLKEQIEIALAYAESGQAILGLLDWYGATGDERYRDAALNAGNFYNEAHLAGNHASLAPGQILALAKAYERTRDTRYRDAVFAWSDRLVGTQQIAGNNPMLIGVFAEPTDQSSLTYSAGTAASVKALTQSYVLARTEGDVARQERYQIAVFLGLANLLSLQYTEVSANNFPYPKSMRGGIRNGANDERVRLDGTLETIEALQLALETF